MYYEEKCQLDFGGKPNDLFFMSGAQTLTEEEYQDDNQHYYSQEQAQKSFNKENLNFQDNGNNQNVKENPPVMYSDATLKMNHEKKVRFPEQLAFKLDKMPLFQAEEPEPIEFLNNAKKPVSKQKGKKKGTKVNKKSGVGFFQPQINQKKRPGSAVKPQQTTQPLPTWNDDTRRGKFFEAALDKQAKRKEEREKQNQYVTDLQGAPVVSKNYEQGKFDVAFMKSNGQPGAKLQMYSNIDQLVDDTQKVNYAATAYSAKKKADQIPPQKSLIPAVQSTYSRGISPSKRVQGGNGVGDIQVFGVQNEDNADVQQVQYRPPTAQQETLQDGQIKNLVAKALSSKEILIQNLENELEKERQRRDQMSDQFRQQLKEFEDERDALERIRKETLRMEKNKQQREVQMLRQEQRMEDDLDMVPSKEKSQSNTSRSIASKTSKIPKHLAKSIKSNRIKTSIPKHTTTTETSRTQTQKSAKYIEELKKQEVTRQYQLQEEEKVTLEVFNKMRDNPNSSLNELQNEVALLNRKVEPLLQRVELAAKNIQKASVGKLGQVGSLGARGGPIGMLSKMGGRLISFYADELADLMLNDFLGDTAIELQKIEQTSRKDYSGEEAKFTAQQLLKNLIDYQSEEVMIDMKWNNPAMKKQLNSIGINGLQREPQPISFNLNEDLDQVYNTQQQRQQFSKEETKNGGADEGITDGQKVLKKQTQQQYQNPFGRGVDPFSQGIDVSQSAAAGGLDQSSYNMMERLDKGNQSFSGIGVEMKGGKDPDYEPRRKWRVDIEKQVLENIVLYKEKFDKYLKMHNNTSNKDVWKIYDHLTDDIFHEIFANSMKDINKDLEQYIEKVIYDEFQIAS